ncbi:hypothetical protein SARC_18290, partial [Sphaeroforma arctica JP610]
RAAANPNALTYNPATGEISYTISTSNAKENIINLTRDAGGILAQLVAKEFNYTNKTKYIGYGTPGVAKPFAEWLADEKTSEDWTSMLEYFGGTVDENEDVADENNTVILALYTGYVNVTESVPEVIVDKEETHFGFRVEDVQNVLPELVYSDNNGVARDIKWNNITTLLVK